MSITLLFVVLFFFLIIRVPIALALGLASTIYIYTFMPRVGAMSLPQQMFAGADVFALTAIPFFILIGEVMNAGGISSRLVYFARCLVGSFRGGMGIVSLLASMIFASFSGSAVANAAGTGVVTIPGMIKSGYPKGLAAAIESTSSTLGAIIPPAIPMIVFGSLAGVSIGGLFIAGYVPGILLGVAIAIVISWHAKQLNIPLDPRSSSKEIWAAAKDALPALFTPILIMGGILGGIMTPTESGAVGVVYCILVSLFYYKEIKLRDLRGMLANAAATTGVVMLVMTVAALFSWILAYEAIPTKVASTVLSGVNNWWVLVLGIIGVLLVVGTFIDTTSALIILTPVLMPLAQKASLDPIYFGIIVTTALTFGCITPPVGVVLFITSSIAKTSIEDTTFKMIPLFLAMLAVLFVLALFPSAILFLPRLFGYVM